MNTYDILNEVKNQANHFLMETGFSPHIVYMDEKFVAQLVHDLTVKSVDQSKPVKNTLMGFELIEVKKEGHINVV